MQGARESTTETYLERYVEGGIERATQQMGLFQRFSPFMTGAG